MQKATEAKGIAVKGGRKYLGRGEFKMTLEIRKEAGMTYLRELRFPIRWTPAAEKVPKQATADAAALSDLYIWPQALANSELVAIDAGPRASPKPLAQTSSAARLSFKAGLHQFVNMVQYYTIFGSKVGSHYVSLRRLDYQTKNPLRQQRWTTPAPFLIALLSIQMLTIARTLACHGYSGSSLRRRLLHYVWR